MGDAKNAPHFGKILSDYVKEHAANMPDKTAINYYGRLITYQEIDESSSRLAAAFVDMGCKKRGSRRYFLAALSAMRHCLSCSVEDRIGLSAY